MKYIDEFFAKPIDTQLREIESVHNLIKTDDSFIKMFSSREDAEETCLYLLIRIMFNKIVQDHCN